MKKSWLVLIVALLASSPQMLAEEATATAEPRTLSGSFKWDARGREGDLEAVFTPTGESTWNVQFHFEFRGKAHTYSGTAEGKLGEGTLSGTVFNESKKRTFTFTGEFADGEFSGTHSERHGESEVETGRLTLNES